MPAVGLFCVAVGLFCVSSWSLFYLKIALVDILYTCLKAEGNAQHSAEKYEDAIESYLRAQQVRGCNEL